ncbi:hypothetical protein [Albimonas pacifica]|uniref:Uncharacterized protein n=1 Tax=Albimonas pacifica TaxID=1114924 RepID=A0A1I3HXR1_9RHOB|nr:hypothetical protein [Albimonas pacifica]SFI40548.1 hypothetical protein SAMN05216258_106231 [Albimonas pacifica]
MSASHPESSATAVAASRPPLTRTTPALLLGAAIAVPAAAALVILPEVAGFEGPGFFIAAPVGVVLLGLVVGTIANRLFRT